MLGTILEANPYLGRIADRAHLRSGTVKPNQTRQGARPRRQRDRAGPRHQGAGLPRPGARRRSMKADAGDIVAIAGLPEATVSHTICAPEV